MLIYQPPGAPKSIPVVDLGPSFSGCSQDIDDVARQIHRACREMGFFYVSHHGVEQALIDHAFEWSARFFNLPMPDKKALNMKQSAGAAGYETGEQQLDSQTVGTDKAPPDLKESYSFGMDLPDDHPWALKRMRNYGHVQWPASLPGFRDVMVRYQAEMKKLSEHLLGLIARSLDLPIDWFAPHFEMGAGSIRLLRYQPHPVNAAFNQIGAGAHTDWGALTVLAQDNIGGLEVRTADGDWVEATPIAGTYVINLGDLMARWTNGIYNANMHRVRNNSSDRDRFSIVSFNSPRPDVIIEPLPGCVSEEFPRKFPTCTAQAHIHEMFRRSYGYNPGQAVA
jgi:isopenicillin N synthase-like dioxygenase